MTHGVSEEVSYRVVFLTGPIFSTKMKELAQPTSGFFTLKISWKTSPGWLQLVFHFGTENREEQLKKSPRRCQKQIAQHPLGMVSTVQKCPSWTCMLRLFAQHQTCKNTKECNIWSSHKGQDVEKKEIFPMLAMLAKFSRGLYCCETRTLHLSFLRFQKWQHFAIFSHSYCPSPYAGAHIPIMKLKLKVCN